MDQKYIHSEGVDNGRWLLPSRSMNPGESETINQRLIEIGFAVPYAGVRGRCSTYCHGLSKIHKPHAPDR